jgi:hypothetical protein
MKRAALVSLTAGKSSASSPNHWKDCWTLA